MKVNAVVVTYNRKDLLIECVNAILSQSYKINKLYIVDNASTDGTYDRLVKENIILNKSVKYVHLDKNIGGSGGFYTGMKYAHESKCDWVWIMDDDTIPQKTCLEEMVNSLSEIKEDKISYLASAIYGAKGEFMNVPSINIEQSNGQYPDWYKYLEKGIVKIKEATFVSLLINDKAILSCGLPVKDYFIWGDDTEYTLRITKFYGKAYFIGKSIAIHKRTIAKQLSLKEENNLNRINFHYYMVRNNLINQKVYYGKMKMYKFLLRKQIESFKILFSIKTNNKIKKFLTIHRGILAFIFKKYDYKAFNNRLNINVFYKN